MKNLRNYLYKVEKNPEKNKFGCFMVCLASALSIELISFGNDIFSEYLLNSEDHGSKYHVEELDKRPKLYIEIESDKEGRGYGEDRKIYK